jgi:CHASE2 domain-containing sensor protein
VQGKCAELVLLGLWLFMALFMAWKLVSLRRHILLMGFMTLFLVS